MDNQLNRQAQWLVEQWRGEFIRVMQAMGDFRPDMDIRATPPLRGGTVLWWKQPFDLGAGAQVWIGTAEETWSEIGRRILSAAGIDSSGPVELKETYLEVLRQSLGVLARAVSSQIGRDMAATGGEEQEPPGDPAFGCQIGIRIGDRQMPGLGCYANEEILVALQSCSQTAESGAGPNQAGAADEPGEDEVFSRACGTLDLLLDLEMPVSVSFGRTQVRIQNILKLTTGSIIEMDRSISEPVELIVNNCTIARGEVVVVDGNYGVRINQVMSRAERLQESRKYLLPVSSSRR